MLTPFLQYVSEARIVRRQDDLSRYTYQEIEERVFLSFLALAFLKMFNSSKSFAKQYANATMTYGGFERVRTTANDLHNMLAVLDGDKNLLDKLSNKQQANLANLQTRQSFLLSDQAAANAAFQFNATSQNQVNQFYSKLSTTVADQNAARIDAMRKFAEAEKSKINALNAQNTIAVNEANAKREETVNRFNATLANQRQQFNVQNQREIDQSNVVWRRAVNTANTAAVNASNQTNAQNLLNLSNWGLSSAWQQWRDEASWVNTSSENEANRNHNLAIAALERSTAVDLQNKASKDAMYQMIGKFGFDLLSGK